MKRDHEQEKKFIEGEFQKKIADLEEQLRIARSGFDAERQALEKKRTDMQADYERQLKELRESHSNEVRTMRQDHEKQVRDMK